MAKVESIDINDTITVLRKTYYTTRHTPLESWFDINFDDGSTIGGNPISELERWKQIMLNEEEVLSPLERHK